MKRKILPLIFLLVILSGYLLLLSACDGPSAYTKSGLALFSINGGREYAVSVGRATYSGETEIVIPSMYKRKPITEIMSHGFCDGMDMGAGWPEQKTSEITSVTIPFTVKTIGSGAFNGCSALKTVNLENNNNFKFEGNCIIEIATNTLISGFSGSVIPDYVTEIGWSAFGDCKELTGIVIPPSVKIIEGSAFSNCTALASVVFSGKSSVKNIYDYTFYNCTSLTEITIPASVSDLRGAAFANCWNLEKITLENGNSRYRSGVNCIIEINTFFLVLGCKTTVVPDYVTAIGNGAFTSCMLSSLTLPASVFSFYDYPRGENLTVYVEKGSKLYDWAYGREERVSFVKNCTLSEDESYVVSFVKTGTGLWQATYAAALSAPARKGYTFGGWATSEGGEAAAYTAASVINAPNDLTLFAIWLPE